MSSRKFVNQMPRTFTHLRFGNKPSNSLKVIPKECVQFHTEEQIVDMPVSPIKEKVVEMIQLIPQERMSDHVVEQIVDTFIRQIREQSVEVVKSSIKNVCISAQWT